MLSHEEREHARELGLVIERRNGEYRVSREDGERDLYDKRFANAYDVATELEYHNEIGSYRVIR